MEIIHDRKRFDKQQEQLLRRLMQRIRRDLDAAGVSADKLPSLTTDIAFSVSSLLDGCETERDGKLAIPVLTFSEDKSRGKLLVEPRGSWLHEYVDAVADDLFGDQDVTEEVARFRKCALDGDQSVSEVGDRAGDAIRVLDLQTQQLLSATKGFVFTTGPKF